jgi:glucose-1-phosphate adenylyltransferase
MHTDAERKIVQFVEKPKEPEVIDTLRTPPELLKELGQPEDAELFQASMGIYIFNRESLITALDNDHVDFGKHIIPSMIESHRVMAYVFQGYWEDIGTIRSFFDSNLELTKTVPGIQLFRHCAPDLHACALPAGQ